MLLGACLVLLGGCDREIAQLGGPNFDPVSFFTGHVRSWGVVEGRSGAPNGTVVTDCQGNVDAQGQLHMTQTLTLQDGKPTQRLWTMWRDGPGTFKATANDMIGTAVGHSDGRVFHWTWDLARSPGNPLMTVAMEQWMYRLPDGNVMIRTTISKLGVILAEVSEQFVPDEKPKLASLPG
jgi:hypothetical protein